jgi:hypothetical protein
MESGHQGRPDPARYGFLKNADRARRVYWPAKGILNFRYFALGDPPNGPYRAFKRDFFGAFFAKLHVIDFSSDCVNLR